MQAAIIIALLHAAMAAAHHRRTTCPSKPSARVQEAADALGDSVRNGKRKASNIGPYCHVVQKVVPGSDDSNGETSINGSISSPEMADDTVTEKATKCGGTDTDEVDVAYDQANEINLRELAQSGDEDGKVSLKF